MYNLDRLVLKMDRIHSTNTEFPFKYNCLYNNLQLRWIGICTAITYVGIFYHMINVWDYFARDSGPTSRCRHHGGRLLGVTPGLE